MGLFSSRNVISVSSTAYNMAGDLQDRTNYLKTTVSRAVLTNAPSIADSIVSGQFAGPTMDQRAFFRWSKNNYPEGSVSGSINNKMILNAPQTVLASNAIAAGPGEEVQVVYAFTDYAEVLYFAERHILTNYPDLYETDWASDYIRDTNSLKIIYEDTSEEIVALPNFDPQAEYLYVFYSLLVELSQGPWVIDSSTSDDASAPDLTSADPVWVQDSIINTVVTETLTTTEETTTILPPNTTTSSTTRDEDVTDYVEVFLREVYIGFQDNSHVYRNERLTVWKRHRIVEDVTVTNPDGNTTVETTTENIEVYYDTQIETMEVTKSNTSNRNMFIYEMGSGNLALDGLTSPSGNLTEFFPIIPLRRDNESIRDPIFADEFPKFKKAFKKSIGTDINSVLDEIEDHEDLDDIDHAFLTFGVELNTEEPEGLRYIYEFMKNLIPFQTGTEASLLAWSTNTANADYRVDLADWQDDQHESSSPRYGDPRPVYVAPTLPDFSVLEIKSTFENTEIPFDYGLQWRAISETIFPGIGKTGAKKGDLWWEELPNIIDPASLYPHYDEEHMTVYFRSTGIEVTHTRLYFQSDNNSYRVLNIYGMSHINRVYLGTSVTITTNEALNDTDESGFIIPIHYPTLKELPLVMANQLGTSNRILVFNSYQVVRQRWWQRGIFKIIFAVIIAIVGALIFPGAIGLLGSHLAVGATLGLSGTAALVVGAAVNAIAAVILSMGLQEVSTAVFGEEFGGIIAAIAGFFIGNMAANFHSTGAFTLNWGSLMRAENLLKLTDIVSTGVQGFAAGQISGIQGELEQAEIDYTTQMGEILEQWMNLGYTGVSLDPLMFTDLGLGNSWGTSPPLVESSSTFLKRSLLTGNDIVELSFSMIEDFAKTTLELPDAFE